MTLQRAHPALVGNHHGDRLTLHKGFLDRGKIMLGRVGEGGAALAERRLRPKNVADLADLLTDLGPLLALGAEQRLDALQLAAQVLVLGADLEFLELAQRPQPHIEDGVGLDLRELERFYQCRLWLVLGADDFYYPVNVIVLETEHRK